MKRSTSLLPGVLAAMLLSMGGSALAAEPGSSSDTSTDPAAIPETGLEFGSYELVPLLGDQPPYAGPATPASLGGVLVSEQVDGLLDPRARRVLARQGFVVVPADLRLFHQAYEEQYYEGTPVFVTSDAAYHTWHLIFDKTLRDLELRLLLPTLEELVGGMLANARAQRRALAGTGLADE